MFYSPTLTLTMARKSKSGLELRILARTRDAKGARCPSLSTRSSVQHYQGPCLCLLVGTRASLLSSVHTSCKQLPLRYSLGLRVWTLATRLICPLQEQPTKRAEQVLEAFLRLWGRKSTPQSTQRVFQKARDRLHMHALRGPVHSLPLPLPLGAGQGSGEDKQ